MKVIYDVDIFVKKDSEATEFNTISVGIYDNEPTLIVVCSQDGGSSLDVDEARQLIDALQKAIAHMDSYITDDVESSL